MTVKKTFAGQLMSAVTAGAVALVLAGCDLSPKFHLPATDGSAAFKEAQDDLADDLKLAPGDTPGAWKMGNPAAAQPRGEWWRVFKDDTLTALEDEAAKGNQNVKAMAARVEQARQTAAIAGAGFFPTLDNTTSFTRRQPNAVARGMTPGTSLAIENDYNTSFGLGYELDLFGRVRNTSRAAKEDAQTAREDLQSVTLSMQADVATLYFTLRSLDREIALLRDTMKLREDSVRILKGREKLGDVTELDVSGYVVDLENTRNQLQSVTQQRRETEHALAVLLGKAPANFALAAKTTAETLPVIPAGLPSGLMERRPDIAAAQHTLASANARIGIARAAFFPSLSLTGSGGFESSVLGDLFQWSSRSWAVGPLVSLPIFSGGSAVANARRSKAVYAEAVANYRETVLEAFRDVEDSLSRLKTLSQQSASQRIAEKAATRAEKLAELRYQDGDIGYLESITARQNALAAQRAGIQIRRDRMTNTVQLIRALGGGWDAQAVAKAVSVTPAPQTPAATKAPEMQRPVPLIVPSAESHMNK
jgi:multidrug efflux system outer membrane protein